MKKILKVVFLLICLSLILGYCVYDQRTRTEIDQVVRSDFKKTYPDYTLLRHYAVDGDFASRDISISFKKPNDDKVYEETWLYLDTEQGWKFERKVEQ